MKKKRIEEVFVLLLLCPPPCLEELRIIRYYDMNLRRLHLEDCNYCGILPPLGNLPNLENLWIEGARSVIAIGTEFLGHKASAVAAAAASSSSTCSVLFPKVTHLQFAKMPNWEKWEWEEEEEEEEKTKKKSVASMSVLPRLIHMNLIRCPKLRSLPVGLAQNATFLTKMLIVGCGSLPQVSSFPFLKELIIAKWPNLESILDLPSLQHLELEDYEMERLPEWLLIGGGGGGQQQQQQFPALQKLQIKSSIGLLRRCLEVGSPDWPKIQHFPRVYGYSRNKAKYFSYTRSGGPKPSFNTNILDDDE